MSTTAPPLRLSANGEHGLPCDPALMMRLRIFVAGDMPRHVLAFDVEQGWVEVIDHCEQGALMTENGQFVTRVYRGEVRVFVARDVSERDEQC